MTNRDFYQETFSQVHSSATIRWEDFEQKKPAGKKPARRLLVLAAAIGLLVLLSAAAVAAHLLGLQDLVLPQGQSAPARPFFVLFCDKAALLLVSKVNAIKQRGDAHG